MCAVEKGRIVSCQMSYFPIDSKKYLEEIRCVLNLIEDSGLQHHVDVLSTTIQGEAEKVFDLMRDIHKKMSNTECNYTMNIMISNICGCDE